MADLYTRIAGDPNFLPNRLEIHDDIEFIVNQIEVLLFTRKGEILGDSSLGANLEDLIYNLNASEGQIESMIMDQIQFYVPDAKRFNISVEVRFFRGTVRDIAVIDVIVNNNRATGLLLT